jgi:SAM-dependent methyltransferase
MTKLTTPNPGPSFEGTLTGGSHAASDKYLERRAWIGEYFDRTAADGWRQLTSDEKVSKVRATVREGRDRMRQTLLSFLPTDLRGWRVLDAGCGTGMLAVDLALRGAEVVAVDLSPTLVGYGRDRAEAAGVADRVSFHDGDMLDPAYGAVDAVVAMDSLIITISRTSSGRFPPLRRGREAPSCIRWRRGPRFWGRCSPSVACSPSGTGRPGSCPPQSGSCGRPWPRRPRSRGGPVAGPSASSEASTARRRTN